MYNQNIQNIQNVQSTLPLPLTSASPLPMQIDRFNSSPISFGNIEYNPNSANNNNNSNYNNLDGVYTYRELEAFRKEQ